MSPALQLRTLVTTDADFDAQFQRVLHWSAETDAAIESRVAEILADVRARGDAAVLAYTARFDHLDAATLGALELTREELRAAFDGLPAEQAKALTQAAEQRSRYWQGRNLRLLDLSLSINTQGGQAERPEQLAVAVCLHDLGMAFLPLQLLQEADGWA